MSSLALPHACNTGGCKQHCCLLWHGHAIRYIIHCTDRFERQAVSFRAMAVITLYALLLLRCMRCCYYAVCIAVTTMCALLLLRCMHCCYYTVCVAVTTLYALLLLPCMHCSYCPVCIAVTALYVLLLLHCMRTQDARPKQQAQVLQGAWALSRQSTTMWWW